MFLHEVLEKDRIMSWSALRSVVPVDLCTKRVLNALECLHYCNVFVPREQARAEAAITRWQHPLPLVKEFGAKSPKHVKRR